MTPTPATEERKKVTQSVRTIKPEIETAIVNIGVDDGLNVDEIEAKIAENMLKSPADGTYSCMICGKSGDRHKSHMKNHVETHMEGLSFPCQICGKTFRSRNVLHKHKYRNHRSSF